MESNNVIQRETTSSVFSSFISKVYSWMALGLLITFGIALTLGRAMNDDLNLYNDIAGILPVLFFLELGIVIAISAGSEKFSLAVSGLLFIVYAIANGIFFGAIFTVYASDVVATTFAATCATFGVMSLYGYVSKQDLTKFGNLAIMGLFGLIIGSVINIFLVSDSLYWITTYLGIAVFIVLTAYDTQKLKNISLYAEQTGADINKLAVRGALTLYLDFINLFILLLRIFGGGRQK